MSLAINHNLIASGVFSKLSLSYGNLSESTKRLSTGLRINSADDDAAGLAIRELQRSDIAALQQGIRNSNDAISLLQTADAALGIIDEKLIRMKELAEQASTGTYDSTQRLILNEEFQLMADEIDRIADATDFNGIHLLNGNLCGNHDGSSLTSTGSLKVHFGAGNDSAEDYYYISIDDCHVTSLFPPTVDVDWPGAEIIEGRYVFEVEEKIAGDWNTGLDAYVIPSGLKNIEIVSQGNYGGQHKPHVNLFSSDGTQLTGYSLDDSRYSQNWWNNMTGDQVVNGAGFAQNAQYNGQSIVNQAGQSVSHNGLTVNMITSQNEVYDADEIITIEEVTDNLVFLIGGHANGRCNQYDLRISCDIPRPSITVQEDAQKVLAACDVAIENKDKIRSKIGALQNRLENTISSLQIQSQNLEMASSRISDVDVSQEMSNFVRSQIITQSAVAMLTQANSFPQMAMRLIS